MMSPVKSTTWLMARINAAFRKESTRQARHWYSCAQPPPSANCRKKSARMRRHVGKPGHDVCLQIPCEPDCTSRRQRAAVQAQRLDALLVVGQGAALKPRRCYKRLCGAPVCSEAGLQNERHLVLCVGRQLGSGLRCKDTQIIATAAQVGSDCKHEAHVVRYVWRAQVVLSAMTYLGQALVSAPRLEWTRAPGASEALPAPQRWPSTQ